MNVVGLLIPLLVCAFIIGRNPRLSKLVANTFSSTENTVEPAVEITQPRNEVRSLPPVPENMPVRSKFEMAVDPNLSDRDVASFMRGRIGEEPILEPASEPDLEKLAERTIRVKLKLDSSTQLISLGEFRDGDKAFVTTIDRSPTSVARVPSSGEISTEFTTRLEFSGLSGLVICLKLEDKEGANEMDRRVIGSWLFTLQGEQEASFSTRRIKNRQKVVMKQLETARENFYSASANRDNLQLFVKSKGLKRLDAVNAAENQIAVLDLQIISLGNTLKAVEQAAANFQSFSQKIQQLHNSCEIEVRIVSLEPDNEALNLKQSGLAE